ncbi:ABC-type transporter, integral membrane subunit (plasmid) [Thermus thermophilus SG0.5JP17-16]|uniref:ABC-type transporter, integral membrane subunit n=1 Tax=Thermus thermophilus (strain SG0.5JP17-16) TaxID=762633 RepID=F6DJ34_THETG|nr:sugar ABC transporter permease [Thermus thermophilus]AEG34431.1 ABC-type transporter, integral membrane subunit [Thermus thermophilus SG0.5JP17-16]
MRGTWVRLLFLGPAGVLVLLFFLVPVLLTLALSLTDLSTVTFSRPRFVGLANYLEILRDPFFPLILKNTFKYVVFTLVFNVLMGLFLALATSLLPERWGDAFRALWLLPRITASVVYVLIWQGIAAVAPYGLLSQLTGVSVNWIQQHPWPTIVLANGFVGASFGMLLFTAAIRAIPPELLRAAAVDGAGLWATVRHVVLPLLRWPILFVTAYQTLSLLTSFEYILLLTDGGPGFYTTEVWALHAYHLAFSNYYGNARFGLGAAMAAILVLIGLLVSLLYLRLFNFRRLLEVPRIEVD